MCKLVNDISMKSVKSRDERLSAGSWCGQENKSGCVANCHVSFVLLLLRSSQVFFNNAAYFCRG